MVAKHGIVEMFEISVFVIMSASFVEDKIGTPIYLFWKKIKLSLLLDWPSLKTSIGSEGIICVPMDKIKNGNDIVW